MGLDPGYEPESLTRGMEERREPAAVALTIPSSQRQCQKVLADLADLPKLLPLSAVPKTSPVLDVYIVPHLPRLTRQFYVTLTPGFPSATLQSRVMHFPSGAYVSVFSVSPMPNPL